MLSQEHIISSLANLHEWMNITRIPPVVIKNAIKENPWYTVYFIQERLRNIAMWLDEEKLHQWLEAYSYPPPYINRVGVIAAGNIPLVGIHDVIAVILSGHQVVVKYSRRDRVLMDWFMNLWFSYLPQLAHQVKIGLEPEDKIDILIASGSNNTARYLQETFSGIQKVIRKHRYSVAVLDSNITEKDIFLLQSDIFLYNGLGCRNVSNILVEDSFDWERLPYLFKTWGYRMLNPLYVEKVHLQRAKYLTLGIPFTDGGITLFVEKKHLESSEMGITHVIHGLDEYGVDDAIQTKHMEIQCVVNKGTDFGMSQYPGVEIFEDDIDLLSILTQTRR